MRYHKKNITKLSTFYILRSQQIFAEFFDSLGNWRVLLSLQCFAMFFLYRTETTITLPLGTEVFSVLLIG